MFLSVIEEITRQKQAEAALAASEHKFASLYAAMNEGLALHELVKDASDQAIDLNAMFTTMAK